MPHDEPVEKEITAAIKKVMAGNKNAGSFTAINILEKKSAVCNSCVSAAKAHASVRITIACNIDLNPFKTDSILCESV